MAEELKKQTLSNSSLKYFPTYGRELKAEIKRTPMTHLKTEMNGIALIRAC